MTLMNNTKDASYIEGEIEEYKNHPLINALPSINSPQAVARAINRYPRVTDEEKALPAHIRRHAMTRILDKFLYPTRAHVQLEQMISTMIRTGYLSRNIADKSHIETIYDTEGHDYSAEQRNAGNKALTSSVIGCSGSGKTTAIDAVLEMYDQAIHHPKYQHVQLVWLKVECPHDGSVKSLCINFFRAIDEVLETDYEQTYVRPRSSAEMLLGDIARLCAIHSVGLLVIDEIQHLSRSKSGGSQKILNFFVTLTNVIKIPVLFIGTPKAKELFSPTLRSARRAAQFGSLEWGRFEHSLSNENDEWSKFFGRLWKLQWFKNEVPLTSEIKELFWEYTQGVAHIAVLLFYLCQVRAVVAGREILDRKLIDKVYNDELSIIHPMIDALRSGRVELIEKYADLDLPHDTVKVLAKSAGAITQEDLSIDDTSTIDTDKLTQLTELLKQFNIGEDIVPSLAEQAIGQHPDKNLFELIALINDLKEPDKPKPKKEKAVYEPIYIEDDLRLYRDDDPNIYYKNLVNHGVVIDMTPYLN